MFHYLISDSYGSRYRTSYLFSMTTCKPENHHHEPFSNDLIICRELRVQIPVFPGNLMQQILVRLRAPIRWTVITLDVFRQLTELTMQAFKRLIPIFKKQPIRLLTKAMRRRRQSRCVRLQDPQ